MLELRHICWTAPGGVRVLQDVSLTVPEGRLMVLTGPNGGGKTTLAKIIAGLETPDSGEILLDGEDITGLNVTDRARKGISFAFQQPVRFKGFTVRKLLELAAGKPLRDGEVCDVLSRVGLCGREYMDREVDATLSGGEIKRIEIATVLERHTRLSLFDEPEAGIDLWSFQNLIGVFESMRGSLNGTLLIISHQERILRIADEIAVIAGGQVRQSGPADRVLPQILSGESPCGDCGCVRKEAAFA